MESGFTFDLEAGVVRDGSIRYILMRPDVLMGGAAASGDVGTFIDALGESTFNNARPSLESYRDQGLLDEGDFLSQIVTFAGRLGWGAWTRGEDTEDGPGILVRNSPFADGFGPSDRPVCAPVKGILRALFMVMRGRQVAVEECECAAQGFEACSFRIFISPTQ